MNSFRLKATLAAFLLAGATGPVLSAETLKIGAIGSLSGGGTAWGLAIKRGAELAVDEANNS
jgi:branched-chain amino acid transport system substrate-binding protein